jgi:uroporphyrinogen decarboxylase
LDKKERVLTTINLAQPDRVPCDFSANRFVLAALRQHLGIDSHRALLEYLGADIVDLRGVIDPPCIGPKPAVRRLSDTVSENFWGMRTQVMQTATGPEECYIDFVLEKCISCEEIEQHVWPQVDWFDFQDIRAGVQSWSDFAVMASGASVFQHPTFLRGLDQLCVDMLLEPDSANLLLDKFTDFYLAYYDRFFTAACGLIDIFRIADDFGMQDRLLISVELFRTYFAPRLKKLIDMAHSHNIKVMFHSCGAISSLIPELIALGIDILDPIQPLATGMQPQLIKECYGNQICLHGGVDTQYLLPKCSPEAIRAEVGNLVKQLGPGGGYIIAPSHVLQTDVPLESILTLYEAAREYGAQCECC